MSRQARYIIQKAPGVGGNPIPEDEPCIVIRAQDQLALPAIDHYLALYGILAEHGLGDLDVVVELEQHREAIAEWQSTHPTKLADR